MTDTPKDADCTLESGAPDGADTPPDDAFRERDVYHPQRLGYVQPDKRHRLENAETHMLALLRDLGGEPTSDQLALASNAAIARELVGFLTRRMIQKGICDKRGVVKEISKELRAWMRTEADLLHRLGITREDKPPVEIREIWEREREHTQKNSAPNSKNPVSGRENK